MYVWIFCCISGVVAFAAIPTTYARIDSVQIAGFVLLSAAACLFLRNSKLRWLCFFLLGFLYAAWRANQVLGLQLPIEQSNRLFQIQATAISSSGVADSHSVSDLYTFGEILASDYAGSPASFSKLKIRSYGAFRPERNQRCFFYARLKAPLGKRNPGGWNTENTYFQHKISALGYVVAHPENHCEVAIEQGPLSRMRAKLIRAFDAIDVAVESKAVLKSLAVAERSDLNDLQWEVFRQTGTSHLMAISGLHITLSTALVFAVVRFVLLVLLLGRRTALVTDISLVASLAGAFFYAAMADFTLPAQRALIMVFVSVAAVLFRKSFISYRGLLLAAFLLLLLEPATARSVGFWLSFGAVAILLLMRATRVSNGWLSSSLRTHCFLSLGLLPITCFLTDTVPLSAPLGNLFAVPIVSLLVVPLVLLGAMAASLDIAAYVYSLQLAAEVWEKVWWALHTLASFSPDVSMAFLPNKLQLSLALLGVALMLVPIIPNRWVFILACLSQLIFRHAEAIKPGEFRIVVLDVGQGLAVAIQTAKNVLVYDTGPSFGTYSTGSAVLVPALKSYGVSKVNRLVISHADNDHAGGYAHLNAGMEITGALASKDLNEIENATLCQRGQSWTWDNVTFDVLSPPNGARGTENDLSCVLRIHSDFGSVLLPGDIERPTEQGLIDHYAGSLASDVLLAPHHGSITSSMQEFVESVQPRYVVFAAGFFNRFNFPSEVVYQRYINAGAITMITSEWGAIEFFIREARIGVRSERPQPVSWKSAQVNASE